MELKIANPNIHAMKTLQLSLFILLLGILAIPSCNDDDGNDCINGIGAIETRTIAVDDFTGINLLGSDNVNIQQGPIQIVEATGHPNIIDRLESDVTAGTWNIKLQDGCYNNYQLSITITLPLIEKIVITGSGNVDVEHFTEQSDLNLEIIGSGNMLLKSFTGAQNANVSIIGSGNVFGTFDFIDLENLNISIVGSGNFLGFPMRTEVCTINIAGSGDCEVYVYDELNVTIDGSGDVRYQGNPVINTNIRGSGNVINAN